MTERHALLVGVNVYAPERLRDLPVALDDVAAMDRSLRTSGYQIRSVTGAPGQQTPSRGVIRNEIRSFLSSVPEGSTALVYFSGHGVHLNGVDYLVPWDAPDRIHPGVADDLLPADLASIAGAELDACPATTIVLAVDACRDNLDLAKSAFDEFGQGAESEASRRRVFTLFACTADATAGFDKELGASVFTVALSEAMRAETAVRTLGEVVDYVRERMAALCRQYNLPPQEPAYRLEVDGGSGSDRVICGSPADDPTATELRRAVSALGGPDDLAAGGPLDELTRRSTDLIRESGGHRLADVWLDPDLPRRTVEAAGVLFDHTKVMREAPAEERLLAAGLLLAVDVTLRHAVATGDHPAYQREVDRAGGRYPALDRRRRYLTERGETTTVQRIDAWIEHRAALAVPELWSAPPFTELVELLASSVETRPVHRAEVVDVLTGLAVEVVAGLPAHGPAGKLLVVNGRSPSGQQLDVRRIALAVRLLRAMSADLRVYGEPIVQEIGLRTGLDAQVAAQEVAGLTWLVDNGGRVLLPSIRCSEPAVDQVVRNLAAEVRTALSELGGVLDDVLDVSDRDVQPSRLGDHPAYAVPVPAITLDTAAVRQLLMGKDLYGSAEVVVRELYQNALDACRYRAVRERYLDVTSPGRSGGWSGRIELRVHELDDGALVLDCFDSGVGMGDVEVDHAFTCAGRRFTDLPPYHEEADRWAAVDPELRLYPNSRFGIGVFSYFMLAEEVEVFTVRQDPGGSLQAGLALHLSAVSGLVDKRPLASGTPEHALLGQGGTLVRLYLDRAEWAALGKSLVRLVGEMLGYTEFALTVRDGDDSVGWDGGALIGDLAKAFPAFECGLTRGWWTDDEAPLLADGIRLPEKTGGYLVNLCGPQQPRLNVSRNEVDAWPVDWVRDRLGESAAGIQTWSEFSLAYLWRLTTADPALAEAVYRQVGTGWLPITAGEEPNPDLDEDIRHVGVFPADLWLIQEFDEIDPSFDFEPPDDENEQAALDDEWAWSRSLVSWRGHAWEPWDVSPYGFTQDVTSPLRLRANDAPSKWGRPAPSPLDSVLLGEVVYFSTRPEAVRVPFGRVARGAEARGLPVVDALRRLLRLATCDIQLVDLPRVSALDALPTLLGRFHAVVRFLSSWSGEHSDPTLTIFSAAGARVAISDLATVADTLGYAALAGAATVAGEPPEDLRTSLQTYVYEPSASELADAIAKMSELSAALMWIDQVDGALGARVRAELPDAVLRMAAPAPIRRLGSRVGGVAPWLSGQLSWRDILRQAHRLRSTAAQTAAGLAQWPGVELPADAARLAADVGPVTDRAAALLGLSGVRSAPRLPRDARRRNGPVSRLLLTSRNERATAAAIKAELSAYKPLGVVPGSLMARRTWPAVSDRQLDLIEAWEELLGADEVCCRTPRPLGVTETFAFIDSVGGDLHRVLDEVAELEWCGLRTALDLSESDGSVDIEGVQLGVLLFQGWEPRIALAAVSFGIGADHLLDNNQWWLRQCPEGLPLTTFDVEHADDDIDYEARLALVAATRNGSAGPPDIQPGDIILTAARAQVTVGEVVEACQRLTFDVPALTCDMDYRPDVPDAALAALLFAIPEPPGASDLELVAELVGAPVDELPTRLLRLGHQM
jgi:uncharacterized caspase-like protein